MTVGEFLKASWEHIPKSPILPPSLFALKGRRAWLAMRPTFTYGDHRDKIQTEQARQAKRQLARDEAWALHEKKKQERARRKAAAKDARIQKKKDSAVGKAKGFKPLDGGKEKATTPKPKRPTVVTTKSSPLKPRTVPQATSPLRSNQPTQRARVVYTVAPHAGHGKPVTVQAGHPSRSRTVPQPTRRPSQQPAAAARPPVVVQPWGPIRASTQKAPATSPRVVRANTYPVVPTQRRP